MAESGKFVVEKQFPEEETWQTHTDVYATEAEAEAAKGILAEVYRKMNWRVVPAETD